MDIAGSTVLISGANRGLGRRLAEELLRRGAKVYAGARNPATVNIPGAIAVALDITDADSVARLAADLTDVDVLINNAGISAGTDLLSSDLADVRNEMETNVFGTLSLTRAFLPQLTEHKGAILNVLSVLSWIAFPNAGGYCVSKSAEWAMTNAVRAGVAERGVQVTALHVGYMDTDMASGVEDAKTDPAIVAALAVDGLAAGLPEVLADDISRHVQAGLAGGVAALYPQLLGV